MGHAPGFRRATDSEARATTIPLKETSLFWTFEGQIIVTKQSEKHSL